MTRAARLWARLEGHVVSGSAWIMVGFISQAVTGIAFWGLAARRYSTAAVGTAAALFASVQFVNYATGLGLAEMLSRHHLLDRRTQGALWAVAVMTTVGVSLAGGALYLVAVDPTGVGELERFGQASLVFGVLCAGTALALLVDVACTAARQWRVVTARLVSTGVVRLPLALIPFVDPIPVRLLLANAGPIALSGLVGATLVPRLTGTPFRPRFEASLGPAVRYAAVNYLSQLAYLAPQFVLPVIVLINVTPDDNAAFFIAWTFTMLVWVLPFTISRVLLSEAGHEDVRLADETRRAMVLAVGLAVAALAVGLAARPLIGWLFGARYDDTLVLLPLLLAGGIPAAVSTVLLGFAHARDNHVASVAIPLVLAVTTLGLAVWSVPEQGTTAAAWAWLIGNSAAAATAVALVVPRAVATGLLRGDRPTRSRP